MTVDRRLLSQEMGQRFLSADDARKDKLLVDVGCPRVLYDWDPCAQEGATRDETTRSAAATQDWTRGGRGKGAEQGLPLALEERLRGPMPVSEASQAREAQKIAARPLVPGVLAGRRSLRLRSAVFGMPKRQPVNQPPPIMHCKYGTDSPPCATELMQPQESVPRRRAERRGFTHTELTSSFTCQLHSVPLP